jgi:hypothetical protein
MLMQPLPLLALAFDRMAQPLFAQFGPAHPQFYWHLPFVIVIVSLVYSATRHDEWGAIFGEALRWGLRLTVFLVSIVVILWLVARFLIG